MAIKPTVTNYEDLEKARGTGEIKPASYYRDSEPMTYFYDKFKRNSLTKDYLDDNVWSEAWQRGEGDLLIQYLSNIAEGGDTTEIDKMKKYSQYSNYYDYMTALSYSGLDDKEVFDWKDSEGNVYGSGTRKQLADQILQATYANFDNRIIEEERESKKFWEKILPTLTSGLAHGVEGIANFGSNIYNLGEGILNIFFNWSNDYDISDRFLYAFANDAEDKYNVFHTISAEISEGIFDWERKYTDIVEYKQDADGNWGYENTTWGKWWISAFQSTGYMLPSMLLGGALGAATKLSSTAVGAIQSGVFYTGIFSSNISDTVDYANQHGISYTDLNAGKVVANAALKAGAQLAIEKVLGLVMGFSGLDKAMGIAGKASQEAVTKNITATGLKAAGIAIGRGVHDMVKEGLEEVFQDLSDDLIDMAFGGLFKEQGIENLTLENLRDAFVVGALVSGVTSVIKSAKYIPASNRGYGVNEKGDIFKMGFFQTLNYNQALSAMAEWGQVIKDPKASEKAKAEAAFKISVSMNTIGSVIQSLGSERAIKANQLLNSQLSDKKTKLEAQRQMSDAKYAEELFDTFIKENNRIALKYQMDKLAEQIKKATGKKADKLRDKYVTKFGNIITSKMDLSDPDIGITREAIQPVVDYMKSEGIDVIVGTDGSVVTRSDKVLFVDNKLIQKGDLSEIIKQESYDRVIEKVETSLNSNQKKLLIAQYEKITGIKNATLGDAITACLFDKSFYTYCLLYCSEGKAKYRTEALQILATIDTLIKGSLSKEVEAGRITTKAYNTLLQKVQSTMRTGLMTYCTQYNRIDLDKIGNDVLTKENKDYIRNHQNVQFSEFIDEGIKETKTKTTETKRSKKETDERLRRFDAYANRYKTENNKEQIEELKALVRSTDPNKRRDGYFGLAILASKATLSKDKLVYIPMDDEYMLNIPVLQTIDIIEAFFGNTYDNIVNGTIDELKLSDEAKAFVAAGGFDLNDKQSRLTMLRQAMYERSKGTITIGNNGELIRVIDKNNFLKDEYLSKKGNEKFRNDVKSGKITKVSQIVKSGLLLPNVILNTKIEYKPSLLNSNGFTYDNKNQIALANEFSTDTAMHEITHVTQNGLGINAEERITGGGLFTLDLLKDGVTKDIIEYIKTTFPTTYSIIESGKFRIDEVLYFLLEGEFEARATLSNIFFDLGFRYKNERAILISPDGKKEWDITPDENKVEAKRYEKFTNQPDTFKKYFSNKINKGSESRDINQYPNIPEGELENVLQNADKNSIKRDPKYLTKVNKFYGKYPQLRNFLFGDIEKNKQTLNEANSAKTESLKLLKEELGYTKSFEDFLNETLIFVRTSSVPLSRDYIDADTNSDLEGSKALNSGSISLKADNIKPERVFGETNNYVYTAEIKPDNLTCAIPLSTEKTGQAEGLLDIDTILNTHEYELSDGTKVSFDRPLTFEENKMNDAITSKFSTTLDKKGNTNFILSNGTEITTNIKPKRKTLEHTDALMQFVIELNKKGYSDSQIREYLSTIIHIGNLIKFPEQNGIDEVYIRLPAGELTNKQIEALIKTIRRFQSLNLSLSIDGELGISSIRKVITPTSKLSDIIESIYEVTEDIDRNPNKLEREYNYYIYRAYKENGSYSKEIGDNENTRYISNKIARESNLKYRIKKGIPIQVDPGIRKFTIVTTPKENFAKLPPLLQDEIKSGTMTKMDIRDYVATAKRMNDYTFKTIAEEVFDNPELAKLTYDEMRQLAEHIEEFATLSFLVKQLNIDGNTKMTPKEMFDLYQSTLEKVKKDEKLGEAFIKADKRSQTVKDYDSEQGKYVYIESHANPLKLNTAFFEHYDGSLNSLRDINNIGKYTEVKQQAQELIENTETGELVGKTKSTWNWTDKMKQADTEYELDPDYKKTIESIPREDKEARIEEYIYDVMTKRVQALPDNERMVRGKRIFAQAKQMINELSSLSDEAINQRYEQIQKEELKPLNKRGLKKVLPPTDEEMKIQKSTTKNIKDQLRNYASTLSRRIAGLKANYNSLSPEVKEYFDPKTYKIIGAKYTNLSDEEIRKLTRAIQEDSRKLKELQSASQRAQKRKLKEQERLDKLQKENAKLKEKVKQAKEEVKQAKTKAKKTLREKVRYEYKTEIKQQNFEFVSAVPANDIVKGILDTAWSDTKMSNVQLVGNNQEQEVANAKTFYEVNAKTLASASVGEIEEAVKFFLDTRMSNETDAEAKKYEALKLYFLGWVYDQSRAGKLYANLNSNLKQRIENWLRSTVSGAGTILSVWNNIIKNFDPLETMKSAEMEIDGVPLTSDEKDQLFEAIKSSDLDKIKEIQSKIFERISNERTNKKSLLRKITTIRSMSMLSSPITWLRNIVSNFAVKRINKLASAIGNKLWTGKAVTGQLKLDKQVTPEIQNFITEHFLDNNLFDELVGNLSKYNPSDLAKQFANTNEKVTKEAIMAQMVIKSMYNQYYNENLFKNKWMNSVHSLLMKALSDNNYVREACVRYFGKILAEKGYDLSKNEVTDNIMNDFAVSAGLALADYMHQDNVVYQIENLIKEKGGEGILFAWKTILPFASASWQWFKAAIKLSPIGLGRAIVNMAKLESRVAKAQAAWEAGKTQVSPELTEYMARRDLGQGVIGTIAWIAGMALAGLGYIRLEDDDYGTPKLYIGNLKIDVSSIFGTSSLLAGAAMITGFVEKGMTWESLLTGLNRMSDVFVDDFFLMDIVQMDMYGESFFDMMTNSLESIVLSFIPNLISLFASLTYTGTLRKTNILEKAMAKIPFLGNFVPKKINPYTGEAGSYWDAINRFIPYFSYIPRTDSEKKGKELGLNKSELTGRYTINDESFNLSSKELTAVNEAYGKWNAKDLADFYDNRLSIKIKVGTSYRTLRYNQMTNEQRKRAVQQIMSKNATYAKILAWTKAGNRYQASDEEMKKLRSLGITKVSKGSKGFIKVN